MNRFNLTFNGEILPGRKPERVKLRFGKMFAIDDPARLERFFSGETIILRRNLDRKIAADYFQKLRQLGVVAVLVKITAEEAAAASAAETASPPPPIEEANKPGRPVKRGMDTEILQRRPGQVDQSWAVSSAARRGSAAIKVNPEQARREEAERKDAEEAARLQAEQAAREQALREEAERQAAEETARLETEQAAREQALREEAERQAAEETARLEAEQAAREQALREEAERQAAEETARLAAEQAAREQALREEAKRKAAAEAARKKAELAEQKRKKAEKRAQLKARRAKEAARLKAEQAAREQALREEAERKAAEEAEQAAREQALREEAERQAAEEAARKKAELAEQKRKKAEERAQLKARRAEEAARLKAEQAAREQALREEAERKAAEEAARLEAEQAAREQALRAEAERQAVEETARLEAEQAAREQALREEAKRKAAAKAARKKAELAQQKRKKAEERAQLKAQRAKEAAREKSELARKKRIEAQETAKLEAELTERKRQATEEVAKQQVILDEFKRKAAAEAAKLQALQEETARKAAQEIAQHQAEQERKEAERLAVAQQERKERARRQLQQESEQKRLVAAQDQQRKAEEHRKITEREAQLAAEKEAQAAQRKAMEEQAVTRAAAELTQQSSLKSARARVKTNLELPRRNIERGQVPPTATRRKHQAGEPNLYSLRPFRNTPEVRSRAERSRAHMRTSFMTAALALAALMILLGRFWSLDAPQVITGASTVAISPNTGPVLLAGNRLLLHDRSGIGTRTLPLATLGLSSLQAPMVFDTNGELIALGKLKTAAKDPKQIESLQLLRCDLDAATCDLFSQHLSDINIAGFAMHELDRSIFIVDAHNGQLVHASSDGVVLAQVSASIPENPVLRLESGLLFMNSALGPAVSVFRYDEKAFGQQLDEILLLPPDAVTAGQSRVKDFVRTASFWWVSMYNPETNNAALYRFDGQWNFVARAELPPGTQPQQLISWGQKTLVRDNSQLPVQRFNANGAPEVPLISDLLVTLADEQHRATLVQGIAWRISAILCALVSVIGLCIGIVQRLRGLVYKSHRERGATPVDEYAEVVHWVDPAPDRMMQLRRTGISYALMALALVLLAIGQSASALQLTALLLGLCGPAIALLLLARGSIGHIGIFQEQLLLVDHSNMYHLGAGPRIAYRGPFLLLDDVVVFTGSRSLPAFAARQLHGGVTPLAEAGIKVDRNTLLVKLLQCRHPIAQGAVATAVLLTISCALLGLQGIF